MQTHSKQSTIKHTAFGNIVKLLGKVPKTTCAWNELRKARKRDRDG